MVLIFLELNESESYPQREAWWPLVCEETQAGTQARRGAKSIDEAARRESEPALICAKFSFPLRNPEKR